MAFQPIPLIDRLLIRIDATGDCWEWTGSIMRNGYGKLTRQDGSNLAHRQVYEVLVGEIPEGLTLDHLCRNRRCVNPDHLEPVTQQENLRRSGKVEAVRRRRTEAKEVRLAAQEFRGRGSRNAAKTHCPQGHPYDDANTRIYRGGRRCKACDRDRANAAYRRKIGGTP